MTRLKVNISCKSFKKENKDVQRSIKNSLMRLADKIIAEGKNINEIFNNDGIIYDRINDDIFIYKTHGVNNTQLRLVYGIRQNAELELYLIDYCSKKKNDKAYIHEMNSKFKNTKLEDINFIDIA